VAFGPNNNTPEAPPWTTGSGRSAWPSWRPRGRPYLFISGWPRLPRPLTPHATRAHTDVGSARQRVRESENGVPLSRTRAPSAEPAPVSLTGGPRRDGLVRIKPRRAHAHAPARTHARTHAGKQASKQASKHPPKHLGTKHLRSQGAKEPRSQGAK
jgi:hypothetical protein